MASSSMSSCEDDGAFTSQFAALLKPIRELTKQACWELNIAEKLDEYIHYLQDLPIEVNVNGEQVKLDFAKAAMVVQNSVQIYSRKVENLWILLQDVISFLSSHKDTASEDPENPIIKLKKSHTKKRFLKEKINLLDDNPLKLRKLGITQKKKSSPKPKLVVSLPFGILQLEEAMSSFNSFKIKIYSYLKEHLGYPSDLRSNFAFDDNSLFLSINPSLCKLGKGFQALDPSAGINNILDQIEIETGRDEEDELKSPAPLDEPEFSGYGNDVNCSGMGDDKPIPNHCISASNIVRHSRNPSPTLETALPKHDLKDPWEGLEPYVDDDVNKPCGAPVNYKLPTLLQKKKATEPVNILVKSEPVGFIDQYLGTENIKKKVMFKDYKPDDEFLEDYAYATKALTPLLWRKRHLKPEREERKKSTPEEDSTDDDIPADGEDLSFDDGWNREDIIPPQPPFAENEGDELDESKQFFELVQQYMAEYTASARGFVHASESMKRVQAWHEMIQPRLQEAESRRDFDIHQYGTQIIESFGTDASIGSSCAFSSLVHEKTKGEVARYFLATLQLANAYNVEILPGANLSLEDMRLKLMSRERHHEQVEGFHS